MQVLRSQLEQCKQVASSILKVDWVESLFVNERSLVEKKVADMTTKWTDMFQRIHEKEKLVETAIEFNNQLCFSMGQAQLALQDISDELDKLMALENVSSEQLFKSLEYLEAQLKKWQSLGDEVKVPAEKLCVILEDAQSKEDVYKEIEEVYLNKSI